MTSDWRLPQNTYYNRQRLTPYNTAIFHPQSNGSNTVFSSNNYHPTVTGRVRPPLTLCPTLHRLGMLLTLRTSLMSSVSMRWI